MSQLVTMMFGSIPLDKQFVAAVKQMDKAVGGKTKTYIVRYFEGDNWENVPMNNIIYKARNPYQLWLKTYRYINSKNPELANTCFYCSDMFDDEYECDDIYSIIQNPKTRTEIAITFDNFIKGDTVWCEEVTLL